MHPKHSKLFLPFKNLCVLYAVEVALLTKGACAFVGGIGVSSFASYRTSGHRAMSSEHHVAMNRPPLPSSIKGILFDMDGTLTDSDTLHFEAYRETFLKVGGTPGLRVQKSDYPSNAGMGESSFW